MGTISLALLLPFLARRGRCRIPRLAALFLAAISLTACAEGGNFLNVPPGVETVTVTITAAGRSIPTTLTVNITD
jgi:hypothetical protein